MACASCRGASPVWRDDRKIARREFQPGRRDERHLGDRRRDLGAGMMLDARPSIDEIERRSQESGEAAAHLPAPLETIRQDISRERAQTERPMLSSTATIFIGSRAIWSAPISSRARSRRPGASRHCQKPMAARDRMGKRASLLWRRAGLRADGQADYRKQYHRVPDLFARQPWLDPQLHRNLLAPTPARCAPP